MPIHARALALTAVALGLATSAGPATAAPVTGQPSGAFTESVGVNVFLNLSRPASEISEALTTLGTTHVRSGLEAGGARRYPGKPPVLRSAITRARLDELLNAIPGLKLDLIGGMQLHTVYKPNNDRMLPTDFTGGWTALLGQLDHANYIQNRIPTDDKVVLIEGTNEANGAWEPTSTGGKKCANGWTERAADQQLALWEYLNGGPVASGWTLAGITPGAHTKLRDTVQLADWSNTRGCPTVASSMRPFLESQKDFTTDYAGFPAWNAGGVLYNGTLASLLPGTGSVQSKVQVGNVHSYPWPAYPPEWLASSAAAVDDQGNRDCGTTPLPGDTATNVTTGAPEAGLKTCAALKAGVPAGGVQRPIIMTETGYESGQVAQEVRATYYPRLLLSNFRYGISRTYLFDLFNEDGNNTLGLIQGGQKTLAYYSVKNTLFLLKQTGAPTAGNLDLTFGGATDAQVRRQLFRTSPTEWSLVLSPTDAVTSPTAGAPRPRVTPTARTVNVTVNGGGFWNATFQSPTPTSLTANGPRTVQAPVSHVQSFSVPLSGDTVVVKLTAG